jgi:myosin heavy subunit
LTSPPPTTKISNQASTLAESPAALYLSDQIGNASVDELKSMVSELANALRDVRLSAAHYKLQYNMAVAQSEEASSRFEVEMAMAHREIDVLQEAEERRRTTAVSPVQSLQEPPVNPANAIMMSELNRQCQMLQAENHQLRDIIDQQRRVTQDQEGELASLAEENDRLKSRIRRNRDHVAPFLPYLEQMNDQSSPRSVFGTPYQSTPRNRVSRVPPMSGENSRGQSNFEALLLADKMLSQETATAPSTPTRSQATRSRYGHGRATHSMSSLPQTSSRRATHAQAGPPRTPPTFSAVNIPQSAPPVHYQQKMSHARRESSNSTITASSIDDEEAFTEIEDDEVPESQASQAATNILRRVTSPKYASAPSSQSAQMIQSKIFGQVKKAHSMSKPSELEKKRLQSAEHHGSPTKRGKIDRGLGLGIGGLRE